MKGLSTMIAAIILIAVTLVVSLIVSGSFSTLAKSQTTTLQNRSAEAGSCAASALVIDDVFTNNSGGWTIIVRNSGLIGETIVSTVISSRSGEVLINSTQASLSKGQILSIKASGSADSVNCTDFGKAVVSTLCTSGQFNTVPQGC